MHSHGSSLEVRILKDEEEVLAFPFIRMLGRKVTQENFLEVLQILKDFQYHLAGAFDGSELVGMAGYRLVCTFARGHHMHIDDLLVKEDKRRAGIGRLLVTWIENAAAENMCGSVFLDAAPGAKGFYERINYEPHTAQLMRKRIKETLK